MKILFAAALAALSANAFAAERTTLMISVEKTVAAADVDAAVAALERRDFTMGTCFLETNVTEYIPYVDAPYHGVALVEAMWQCDEPVDSWIAKLGSDERYRIWANGRIAPMPSVSVRD